MTIRALKAALRKGKIRFRHRENDTFTSGYIVSIVFESKWIPGIGYDDIAEQKELAHLVLAELERIAK